MGIRREFLQTEIQIAATWAGILTCQVFGHHITCAVSSYCNGSTIELCLFEIPFDDSSTLQRYIASG